MLSGAVVLNCFDKKAERSAVQKNL